MHAPNTFNSVFVLMESISHFFENRGLPQMTLAMKLCKISEPMLTRMKAIPQKEQIAMMNDVLIGSI
jgi:hypothetical protein